MLHNLCVCLNESAFLHTYIFFPTPQFKKQVSYLGEVYDLVIILPTFTYNKTQGKNQIEGRAISNTVPVSLLEYRASKDSISIRHSIPNLATLALLMA